MLQFLLSYSYHVFTAKPHLCYIIIKPTESCSGWSDQMRWTFVDVKTSVAAQGFCRPQISLSFIWTSRLNTSYILFLSLDTNVNGNLLSKFLDINKQIIFTSKLSFILMRQTCKLRFTRLRLTHNSSIRRHTFLLARSICTSFEFVDGKRSPAIRSGKLC